MRIPETAEAARQDVYTIGLLQTFLELRHQRPRDERAYWSEFGKARRELKELVSGVVRFCLTNGIDETVFATDALGEVSMRGGG